MYIPSPLSIYKDIYKLPPGSYLQLKIINQNNIRKIYTEKVKKWIDFESQFKTNNKTDKSFNTCLSSIENKLTNSIEKQLISDVPVGVFLSGGIDSSLITSILTKKLNNKPQTFTIDSKTNFMMNQILLNKLQNISEVIIMSLYFLKNMHVIRYLNY